MNGLPANEVVPFVTLGQEDGVEEDGPDAVVRLFRADMVVRERYILGGGSSDLPCSFTYAYAQRALDWSVINGVRLAQYANDDSALTAARRELPRSLRDYATERPTADGEFSSFLGQFEYDRTPLNARVEQRDTNDAEWNIERVSFDAEYGGERMKAALLLPNASA